MIYELERTIDDTNEVKKQIVERFVKNRREGTLNSFVENSFKKY
jgi:hypothetical protein